MKKTIIIMALIAMMSSANASIVRCTGMSEKGGYEYHILMNDKTNKLIMNNDVFTITSGKKNDITFFTTENYVNKAGRYVYNILAFFTKGKYEGEVLFQQRNVVTNEPIATIEMSCYVEK